MGLPASLHIFLAAGAGRGGVMGVGGASTLLLSCCVAHHMTAERFDPIISVMMLKFHDLQIKVKSTSKSSFFPPDVTTR